MQKHPLLLLYFVPFALIACMLAPGCNSPDAGSAPNAKGESAKASDGVSNKRPKIAVVTNGIANFWTIAKVGALKAGEDFNCDVDVKMPPADGGRASNQKRMLEQLISRGFEGIAVSPVSPENQTAILNEVGDNAIFITQDSDAPDSNRLLYIGMPNYEAGRMAGELVKQAIPEGGNIVIFIGSLDQHNAKLRRQGLIDEVLGRSHDDSRYDAPGQEIGNDQYNFLATRIDDFDDTRKKELPEQALAKFEKIDCMVGLFEYNPPFIFDALQGAGKLGEIKVVGFDESLRTLDEIKRGNCVGTVVQNPYMYGYKSVEVLARLCRGDESDLKTTFIEFPARKIVADNVDEFRTTLMEQLGIQESETGNGN